MIPGVNGFCFPMSHSSANTRNRTRGLQKNDDVLCLPPSMAKRVSMNRRKFLQTGATAALALSTLPHYAADFGDMKKRVGLIGCGWYGKCDLFRLIQVAPGEVVSLCDVDKRMLAEAADQVAARQASRRTPRRSSANRAILPGKDPPLGPIAPPAPRPAL